MDKKDKDYLYSQLIRLGDMMGDGLHHEPDGNWISKEYRQICKQLGLLPKRKNDSEEINKKMDECVNIVKCKICTGDLKQTRKGSMRAKCLECGALFKLLTRKKKKP